VVADTMSKEANRDETANHLTCRLFAAHTTAKLPPMRVTSADTITRIANRASELPVRSAVFSHGAPSLSLSHSPSAGGPSLDHSHARADEGAQGDESLAP
jgi:hypothetical protein